MRWRSFWIGFTDWRAWALGAAVGLVFNIGYIVGATWG
jgi:hypothetical protein